MRIASTAKRRWRTFRKLVARTRAEGLTLVALAKYQEIFNKCLEEEQVGLTEDDRSLVPNGNRSSV